MGALIWRELAVVVRTPAFWVSTVLYICILAAYVLVWGEGIPIVGARSNWEQFTMTQRVILAILLPWTAARCGYSSRRELALLGLLTARPPSVILFAKWAALGTSLLGMAVSALPVTVLMQQVAAVPTVTLVLDMVPLAAIAFLVAGVTTLALLAVNAPTTVWVITGGTMLAAAIVGPPSPGAAAAKIAAAAIAVALGLLAVRAMPMYLPESDVR